MEYQEFVARAKEEAGIYDWLLLTQEKIDIARGGKIYSVEALVFGAALQGMVRKEECTEAWIADTVHEMIKTVEMLGRDAQGRRDRG